VARRQWPLCYPPAPGSELRVGDGARCAIVAKKLFRISGVIDGGGTAVEANKATEVGGVGTPSMHRSIGVGQIGEEVRDEGAQGCVPAIAMWKHPFSAPPAKLEKRREWVWMLR
jgi:hypothetical protein